MTYCGVCFTGSNLSNIILPFLSSWIINPDNLGSTAKYKINGEVESFLDFNAAKNFPVFCWFLAIY